MRPLVWIRVDLRARDNTALLRAAERASRGALAVFLVSPSEWESHDEAPCKIEFRLRCLAKLSSELKKRNIALLIRSIESQDEAAPTLLELARERDCTAIFFNQQYEVDELQRDAAVARAFTEAGLETHEFCDELIFPPGTLRTGQDKPYTVFTPFKKKWIARYKEEVELDVGGLPKKQPEMIAEPDDIPERIKGFESDIDPDQWPAGESAAKKRLDEFVDSRLKDYDDQRDLPAVDGTSRLSVYLNSGVLSTRQCLAAALEANNNRLDSGAKGAQVWISELIWREFYRNILFSFPRVCRNQPFQAKTRNVQWSDDEDAFNAWTEARTGFPIVDAAMRQLNTTGWMHNRLRMITAMFLTKDLLIDWRWGERYFMRRLIDGDFASNNGGWQWSASTGTDAAPYFRIFNPTTQGKRYDPDGEFIRLYLDELADLGRKQIHDPDADRRAELDYPEPIVDHSEARERALAAFKNLGD